MKKGLTELVFILDRSGSMQGMEKDTIGGFNSMIDKQKREEGEALVSTVLFDHHSKVLHDRIPLKKIKTMRQKDYTAGGSTALLDAIGGAIHHIRTVHKYIREKDRPEKTMVVIMTDGLENASSHYTLEHVKEDIERQKERYGWEFLFLGANIDAVEAAGCIGIDSSRSVNFHCDREGTQLNYEVVGEAITGFRMSRPLTAQWKTRIEKDYKQRKKG